MIRESIFRLEIFFLYCRPVATGLNQLLDFFSLISGSELSNRVAHKRKKRVWSKWNRRLIYIWAWAFLVLLWFQPQNILIREHFPAIILTSKRILSLTKHPEYQIFPPSDKNKEKLDLDLGFASQHYSYHIINFKAFFAWLFL